MPEYRTDAGGYGGVAAVADFLLDAFHDDSLGWSVTLYSPRMSRKAPESRRLLEPRSWLSRPVLRRREGGTPGYNVGCHLAELEFARYLPRRILDAELASFDAIVVVAGSPAAASIASRVRVPVILQVATMAAVERRRMIEGHRPGSRWFVRLATMITTRLDHRALRSVDVVVVENHWMNERCRALGAKAVELCPPGVDTEKFSPLTEPVDGNYLVMVARLSDPRKDLPTLFRAVSVARAQGMTQNVVLAGRGGLTAEDLELRDELGLADQVEVKSDLSQGDLISLLQRASLFVMSSSEEGLGIAIVEAMACGLPVVSTATEGARFVVDASRTGALVGVGDHAALGTEMAAWMIDPIRRAEASLEARRRAVDVFSKGQTGQQFKQIVTDAAGEHIAK